MQTQSRQILTLEDVQKALEAAGYVTQHENGKDESLLFLLAQQPVSVTVGKNYLRLAAPVLELKDHLSSEAASDLFAELLATQIAVAPFAFAVLPGEDTPGTLVLLTTLVLTAIEEAELIETIHRLPGALVTAEDILKRYAV